VSSSVISDEAPPSSACVLSGALTIASVSKCSALTRVGVTICSASTSLILGSSSDELMPKYASLIYNGFWFAPERLMLQALIDKSQERVEGKVRLKLYKGNVYVMGRESPRSLYSMAHVTFEEDSVYDQKDAQGFIKLNALRLRIGSKINKI
jgi:argininosuccinate synthase